MHNFQRITSITIKSSIVKRKRKNSLEKYNFRPALTIARILESSLRLVMADHNYRENVFFFLLLFYKWNHVIVMGDFHLCPALLPWPNSIERLLPVEPLNTIYRVCARRVFFSLAPTRRYFVIGRLSPSHGRTSHACRPSHTIFLFISILPFAFLKNLILQRKLLKESFDQAYK